MMCCICQDVSSVHVEQQMCMKWAGLGWAFLRFVLCSVLCSALLCAACLRDFILCAVCCAVLCAAMPH